MPVTLTQIAANTASLTIQTDLGPVNIVYYPSKVTDKRIAEAQSSGDSDTYLTNAIKSWDILEDEESGTMLPISRVDDLGNAIKVQIFNAVMRSFIPNQTAPQS